MRLIRKQLLIRAGIISMSLLFFGMGLCLTRVSASVKSSEMSGKISEDVKTENIISREEQTLDLLSRIDAFAEQDEELRTDAARAHYNMGNIYFQKGDFQVAAREYYQAMILMPDDPDVHYNLAFVSGEHLMDFETALKHYRMYLYLNPEASDKHLVKEKIINLELIQRQVTDSPLEKQEKYKY